LLDAGPPAAYDECMTNTTRIPFWHWLLTFGGIPLAGALLSFYFVAERVPHPFAVAAVLAGVVGFAIDFTRRHELSAALTGVVSGLLAIPFAFGLFVAILVFACSTGSCGFD
jgi:threonine/homoserine efflux transporter RhtA